MPLNTQQHKAAGHLDGPLLVLAGAGSGKTRCLTFRIANLLEVGIPADAILAVTFTNKAAGEMRNRVHGLTKQNVLVSTFHSLGARILREEITNLGYTPNFSIYDQEDSDKLLKSCIEELSLQEDKIDRKALKSKISLAKDALEGPEDLAETRGTTLLHKRLPDLYALYQKRLQNANAVDFDDLLFLTAMLFRNHPEVLQKYQTRWRYLLIDEYQDTNRAQYEIAKMLVGGNGNIFAVGDPDQSIYSWRGADIGNILNFEQDFPGGQVLLLEQNYRSTTNILNAANGLINYNFHRYEKELWSDLGEGEPVQIVEAADEREEARFAAAQIRRHHEDEGIPLNEMAIFYRANFQSRPFEDQFFNQMIPFAIIGGISFYQRREVKDILSFLRVAESGCDFISFARTINIPKRGIGDKTIENLRAAAESEGLSIFEYCSASVLGAPLKQQVRLNKKQKEALAQYTEIIKELRSRRECPIEELISAAIDLSDYRSHLRVDPESYDDRLSNLLELSNKGAEWEMQKEEEEDLASFLQDLTLKTSVEESVEGKDHVSLMTLHNAKGLEFRVAFVVGMEQDLLPHVKARNDEDSLEEERRLCYVGMTRAKQYLYLSRALLRRGWGGEVRRPQASRFLAEIPLEYCQESSEGRTCSLFNAGDPVFHREFGIGVVQEIYEGAGGLTCRVLFSKEPFPKNLLAKSGLITKLS